MEYSVRKSNHCPPHCQNRPEEREKQGVKMEISTIFHLAIFYFFNCLKFILFRHHLSPHNIFHIHLPFSLMLISFLLIFERGGREREKNIILLSHLIYAFIGWFWYVPCPGIKPTTVAYPDNALTNWATQLGWSFLGLGFFFFFQL